jgi:hypothetical protein
MNFLGNGGGKIFKKETGKRKFLRLRNRHQIEGKVRIWFLRKRVKKRESWKKKEKRAIRAQEGF